MFLGVRTMQPEAPESLARRLAVTLEITADPDAQERLRPHIRWEMLELMRRVPSGSLHVSEMLAITGILAAAHSRVLTNPRPLGPGRRGLHIIR